MRLAHTPHVNRPALIIVDDCALSISISNRRLDRTAQVDIEGFIHLFDGLFFDIYYEGLTDLSCAESQRG